MAWLQPSWFKSTHNRVELQVVLHLNEKKSQVVNSFRVEHLLVCRTATRPRDYDSSRRWISKLRRWFASSLQASRSSGKGRFWWELECSCRWPERSAAVRRFSASEKKGTLRRVLENDCAAVMLSNIRAQLLFYVLLWKKQDLHVNQWYRAEETFRLIFIRLCYPVNYQLNEITFFNPSNSEGVHIMSLYF